MRRSKAVERRLENNVKIKRASFIAAAAALSGLTRIGQGGTVTWSGATNGSWGTGTNWNGGSAAGATGGSTTNGDTAYFDNNSNTSVNLNDGARNVQNITFDTSNVGSFTIGSTGGNALDLTSGGTIQMTSTVGQNETINAPIVLEGVSGSYTFTDNASSNSDLLIFGAGITGVSTASTTTTLNLGGSNIGAFTNGSGNNAGIFNPNNTNQSSINGVIGNGSAGGTVGVTKSGAGVWDMTAVNTYTGATIVNGGVLQLVNSGAIASTSVTVNAGATLELNNLNGTPVTSSTRLSAGATLTLNGGTFQQDGGGGGNSENEQLSALAIGPGVSRVVFDSGNNGSNVLNLSGAAPLTQSGGGTFVLTVSSTDNDSNPSANQGGGITFSSQPTALIATEVGGGTTVPGSQGSSTVSILPWAIGAFEGKDDTSNNFGADFVAVVNNSGTWGLVPLCQGVNQINDYANFSTGTSTNNVLIFNNSQTVNGATTLNSLNITSQNGTNGDISINNGFTLSVTSGAVILNPASSHTEIAGVGTGTLALGNANNLQGYVYVPTASTVVPTISAIISNGSTSPGVAFSFTQGGSLILSAANTYTGTTTINGGDNATGTGGGSSVGTLVIGHTGSLASTTGLLLNNGILQLSDGTSAISQTVTSLTTGTGTSGNAVVGGYTSASTLTVNLGSSVSNTFSGKLGGSATNQNQLNLAVSGNSSSILTLTGANTYTGTTTVTSGTLKAGAANTLSTSSAITVSGGTLDVSGFANTVPSLAMSSGALNFGVGNLLTSSGAFNFTGGMINLTSGTATGTAITVATAASVTNSTFTSGTNTVGYHFAIVGNSLEDVENANQTLVTATPNPLSIFAGASTTVSATLTNTGGSALHVNLTGAPGTGGTFTAITTGTLAAGNNESAQGTLLAGTAGTGQTWSITNTDSAATTTSVSASGVLNVYNHAASNFAGGTLTLPTVIVGYTSPVSSNSLSINNTASAPAGALLTSGTSGLANVTLNNLSSVAAGSSGSLTATLATGQGLGTFSNTPTVAYGDASSYVGPTSSIGSHSITITGDVEGHASASVSSVSGSTSFGTVIIGASVTPYMFNIADAGGNVAGLQIASVAGTGSTSTLSGGPTLSTVIAAGASSTPNYSLGINTSTIGAYSATQTFTTGDDQSVGGHNALSANVAINVTGNVEGHSSASVNSVSGSTSFGTVIIGASVTPYMFNIADASGNVAGLQIASVAGTGSTSTLSGGPAANAVVAAGSNSSSGSSSYSFGINTGTLGAYSATQTFMTGDDQSVAGHNSLSANVAINITGNVEGHSAATFTSATSPTGSNGGAAVPGSAINTDTINLGSFAYNAGGGSETFSLSNLIANLGSNIANLQLTTAATGTANPISYSASSFSGLTAGAIESLGGTAVLSTMVSGNFSNTYTLNLEDDQNVAGTNGLGSEHLTLILDGSVGPSHTASATVSTASLSSGGYTTLSGTGNPFAVPSSSSINITDHGNGNVSAGYLNSITNGGSTTTLPKVQVQINGGATAREYVAVALTVTDGAGTHELTGSELASVVADLSANLSAVGDSIEGVETFAQLNSGGSFVSPQAYSILAANEASSWNANLSATNEPFDLVFEVDNSNPLYVGMDFSGENAGGITGIQVTDIGVVPEPASMGLLAVGVVGALAKRRRRKI